MTKEFYTRPDGVVPTLSTMELWKGWGTQLCGLVKL